MFRCKCFFFAFPLILEFANEVETNNNKKDEKLTHTLKLDKFFIFHRLVIWVELFEMRVKQSMWRNSFLSNRWNKTLNIKFTIHSHIFIYLSFEITYTLLYIYIEWKTLSYKSVAMTTTTEIPRVLLLKGWFQAKLSYSSTPRRTTTYDTYTIISSIIIIIMIMYRCIYNHRDI